MKRLYDLIAGRLGLPTFAHQERLIHQRNAAEMRGDEWKFAAKEFEEASNRSKIQAATTNEAIRQIRDVINKVPM